MRVAIALTAAMPLLISAADAAEPQRGLLLGTAGDMVVVAPDHALQHDAVECPTQQGLIDFVTAGCVVEPKGSRVELLARTPVFSEGRHLILARVRNCVELPGVPSKWGCSDGWVDAEALAPLGAAGDAERSAGSWPKIGFEELFSASWSPPALNRGHENSATMLGRSFTLRAPLTAPPPEGFHWPLGQRALAPGEPQIPIGLVGVFTIGESLGEPIYADLSDLSDADVAFLRANCRLHDPCWGNWRLTLEYTMANAGAGDAGPTARIEGWDR
jgi:hypothetical protein